MSDAPFAAYEGDEPYLFVCYAHADAKSVFPELIWLRQQGFNIWFDEGISPGAVWRDELAAAIDGAALFLFFVSQNAVASHNCQKEVSYATDLDLPLLSIYLEATSLPRGLRLAIVDRQAINMHDLARAEYEAVVVPAIGRQLGAPAKFSARPRRTSVSPAREDRIHVAVAASNPSPESQTIAASIARYISWLGGIYRPHLRRSDGNEARNAQLDFRVEVGVERAVERTAVSWFVHRADSEEIIWASQSEEASHEFADKRERIAEMIGEGGIRAIADDELHRISALDTDELGYSRLLLKADQLNYHDSAQIAERLSMLKRAIDIEPNTGLAHASLASLLSWQIINGTSSDAKVDQSILIEEAALALRHAPNEPFVLLAVGTAFCRIGEYERGLGLIRRAHAKAPTVRAKDELARSLCFAGQPLEAIGLFNEILTTMPAGNTFPYVRLAVAYTQAGQLSKALEHSTSGIVHFSRDYYTWLVHANLLRQFDRVEDAHAALAEAKDLLPNIRLDLVIDRTEATYGRTAQQRRWLTDGLRTLSAEDEC